jgi:AAA domain
VNSDVTAAAPERGAAAGDGSKRRQKAVKSRTAMGIQPRRVEWLWHGLVPFGAITVLSGQPGLGKSLLTVRLAAEFSGGRLGQSGNVLMLTAEDPIAEVVVPRLKAAHAKLTAIHFAEMEDDGLAIPMRFPEDIDNLAELVREHAARLVVIDPLSAHLEGRVDSWKDQSIRGALAPLAALAEERGIAVVVVAHLNKGQSSDPLQRLGGSIGLPAAARSVLLLGRDPDDPKGERGDRRVLAHVKSNFGRQAASLALRIEQAPVEDWLPGFKTAMIIETGTSPYQGSDLLRNQTVGDLPEVTTEAVSFLRQTLADGPRRVKEIEAEATQAAIPWETVKRAKKNAGVKTRKERGVVNGSWVWELAAREPASAEQPAA